MVTYNPARVPGRGLAVPSPDPFDRLLIPHSLLEDIPIVKSERVFYAFGVNRIW